MSNLKSKLVIFIKFLQLFLLLLFPVSVFADPSIGSISEDLMGPTAILTKMVLVACYMVGVGLIIFSLAQYKQHRQNPKLVPLGTPIILFILGVVALLIPYVSVSTGETGSAAEQVKKGPKSGALPPMADHKKKRLPGPGRYTPSDVDSASEPEVDYYDEGDEGADVPSSGHWTDSYD
tara:strand:+ start:52153 stop:52686 length:534 start_codon:yes stop_codon:yes gene_type:complete